MPSTEQSNSSADDLCEFCGDSPADFACAVAGCRRLCRHCEPVWHGHPDRRRHARHALPHSRHWQCPHCTFDNSDSRALVCAMCDRSPGPGSGGGTADVSVSDGASSSDEAAQHQQQQLEEVPCLACTLLNPASSVACQLCAAPMGPARGGGSPGGGSNSNNSHAAGPGGAAALESSVAAAEERRLLERERAMLVEQRLLANVTRLHNSLSPAAATGQGRRLKGRRDSMGCTDGFCSCGRG